MIILNPEAAEEQQAEIIERVQQLLRDGGGVIDHVNDWGRRKISYPMQKHGDGRYIVITCSGEPGPLAEIERVLSISPEVVVRALFIRLTPAQAERARSQGAPPPVDIPDERPSRGGGRRGGRDGGREGGGRRGR
jgi:small subunit ribosomal protein S6